MDKQALIKAVIFDLGNVVLFFDNRKISRFIAARCRAGENEIHAYIFGTSLERDIDRGRIGLGEYLGEVNRRFSCGISIAEFSAAWNDMFTANESLEPVIKNLKENNYRLGLLSNTNEPHFEHVMSRFRILQLFDDYHLSFRTGVTKPDPAAFRNLTGFYSCEPQNLVFTDDIEANSEAARRLGINSFLFKSAEGFLKDLSSLGIKLR